MDDEIAAAARRIKGSLKEAIGMLTGNPDAEAEGAAEKAAGRDGKSRADRKRKKPDGDRK